MVFEKKNTIIEEKVMDFAVKVVNLKKRLNSQKHEYNISDQLQRSGSAIGALYGEAHFAESDADFVHKLRIALKECHESLYWIELLYKTEYLPEEECKELYDNCVELRRMLTSSVNTVNRRLEQTKRS